MAAQKGLEMLLKVDTTGAGAFATVGGGQTTGMTINNQSVEVTSQDDTSRFRQLLAGAGVRSLSFTLEGVFKVDAAIGTVNTYALADTIRDWQCIVPDFGTFEGNFQIASLEFSGEQDGEVRFSISLESGGDVTFAAA